MRRPTVAGVLILVLAALAARPGRAAADDLVDLLRQKGVLSADEATRVQQAPLRPEQRRDLIDVLHGKGVLSDAERARLAAPPAAVAGAPPPSPPAAAPAAVAAPSTPSVGYDEGFFVRTADGHWQAKLGAHFASNVFFYEPDTVQHNTQTVDRARLTLDASMYRIVKLRVQHELSAGSNGLRDAFLALTPAPAFNIQVGQFKIPFSYEGLLSKRYTNFVERAAVVTSTFNPLRDVGVMAYGSLFEKALQYQIAGMNGAGQNRSDSDGDKDVVARIVVAPFAASGAKHLRGLNAGGAVTYGYQGKETTRNADGTTAPVRNSIAGTTDPLFTFYQSVPRRGFRLRAGTHVAWLDGPFGVVGEYIHTAEERRGLAADGGEAPDLETNGGYVDATWLITGETKPFNARVRPARPLWTPGGGFGRGAWEAALRYEIFDLERGAETADGDDVENRYQAFVAGVNWYPYEVLRLSLNYVYGYFDEAGSGLSPNPEKHATNAVLTRVQLEF